VSLVRGGSLCRRRVSDACARIDPRASVNLSIFFLPRHGKRDIASSFRIHLGYNFFISPGEGESGIIF
jgi:hypothetical protein